MFQPPVNNLEKIRKARKRVKQMLLQIGLESCREALEEINCYNPGDNHFSSTSWEDVSLWEANGRRNDYRSKPFCCSLCKYSTHHLSSFKVHLKRYHEDEKDQELMSACPNCPFTSQSKTVAKHVRIFHHNTRKIHQTSIAKENPNLPRNAINFSCSKCSFSDTLYYSIKKHMLLNHYEDVFNTYFGEISEKEETSNTQGCKNQTLNKFLCKQCSYTVSSRDALIYHILTSEKHRDLEQRLRTDIIEISRAQLKKNPTKPGQSGRSCASTPKQIGVTSDSFAVAPTSLHPNMMAFPENGSNQPSGMSAAIIQNAVQKFANVSDPPGNSVQNPPPAVASPAQVGFVNTSLPQNQSITLQASLPQSVFLSPKFPLNQPVNATVLPSGGQILPTTQTTARPAIIPLNQQLLPVNQSAVLACAQPAVISVNQPVRPGNLQGNPPGVDSFLAAPMLRQLIPTGKQVNGMPTYTLAPISVTMPVAPSAVPTVNLPKVPVQMKSADKVALISQSLATTPSTPVLQVKNTTPQKTAAPVTSSRKGKEAKQWKTCPVCNELFPSNVYEVHMQIAHIKSDEKLKSTNKANCNEATKPVTIAAQASFLKMLKDNSIKCMSCRTLTVEGELLKHLLMHGMICLFCKAVFHEMRNFVYHMKIMHMDKGMVHLDFIKKGISLPTDDNGAVLFPHFDYNLKVSKDEVGDKEINLAVVTGANSQIAAATIYIKIQHKHTDSSADSNKETKCTFCNCTLSKNEVYDMHLKEKHHIMPTVHTILKTPAYKCIHCCGVYTGSMTLSAIAVHLIRCRNAPKDSSSVIDIPPDNAGKSQLGRGGMHDYAKTQKGSSEIQAAGDESVEQDSEPNTAEKELSIKRRKVDDSQDHSKILVMLPDKNEKSHEYKKQFLTQYFNKRPYPSKKEIQSLSLLLGMWRSDVASYIGTRRYMCMKFLKNHKQRVLLGFQMLELKRVKHDMDIKEDY
ncbi:activity-dependent neuroprotector homeobox protein 2 isoform 2-T2 [Pelodytes ibericus]